MRWSAVLTGVALAVVYLGVLYLLPPLEGVGLAAAPLLLGAGPLAGAGAGALVADDTTRSARHGLAAGAVAGVVFALAFWHVLSVPRFDTLTPFGRGGAFYAAKLVFVYSAGDLPIIARHPGRMAGALALGGAAAIALLGAYAGHAVAAREEIAFVR
jgi:hypothetical protein